MKFIWGFPSKHELIMEYTSTSHVGQIMKIMMYILKLQRLSLLYTYLIFSVHSFIPPANKPLEAQWHNDN